MSTKFALPGQPLGPSSKYNAGPGTHTHATQVCASIAGHVAIFAATSSSSTSSTSTSTGTNTKGSVKSASASRPGVVAKQTLTIAIAGAAQSIATASRPLLPALHDRVLARVLKISHRQANLAILAVSPASLASTSTSSSTSGPAPAPAASASALPSTTAPQPETQTQHRSLQYTTLATPLPALLRPQDIRATHKDTASLPLSYRPNDIIAAVVLGVGDQVSGYYVGTAGNEYGVVGAVSERGVGMVGVSWREMGEVESWGFEAGDADDGRDNEEGSGKIGGVGVGEWREERKVARPLGMGS